MIKTILKTLFLIIFFYLLQSKTFACEVEETFTDLTIITNSKNNIREEACKNSKKLWQTKIWEKYQVVADAWEYYKIIIDWKESYIFKEWVDIVSEDEEILEEKIEVEEVAFQTEIWKYWLELYNIERKKLWLHSYKYDIRLQNSAEIWSKLSANKWYIDHKRNKNDAYYNFNKIQNWFKNNWVNCKIENRTWAVENIWYWFMNCKNGNCLEETKKVVKQTFDMYMREKWKKNDAHYKAIISKNLNFMWFGIYKKNLWNGKYKVYNTTHFCTNFAK